MIPLTFENHDNNRIILSLNTTAAHTDNIKIRYGSIPHNVGRSSPKTVSGVVGYINSEFSEGMSSPSKLVIIMMNEKFATAKPIKIIKIT